MTSSAIIHVEPRDFRHLPHPRITQTIRSAGAEFSIVCDFLCPSPSFWRETRTYRHPSPPFARIFALESGSVILETGDGVRTLVPHRIYLLPPERPFEATYRRGTKITAFHVYIGDRFGFPLGRDLDGIPEIRDRRIFDAVIAAVESGEEPVWQAAAFQTVTIFCRPLFPKLEQRARMSPVLKKVVDIIAAMPPGKLRVATIAEEMHTSRAALSKSFERQFKIPLKRYIRDTAVHAAKKFLLNADMTVAEVACRLGYKEPSYFQRVFKQCVGMTPFTYRRKHRFPAS